ncbi:hypothetical protein DPMN_089007 [Dreissena polymorpha]|uniref:Uncharacterized protein n=1 Tax=Dreissena polymorpha TaxID=45954 RepID=A0A9D4QYE6_DREPO|nr:hypothetical protein DPMN_089007 [Dreissena polymorpha]
MSDICPAFGGCLRDVEFDSGRELDFLKQSIEVINVNMDGCAPYHVHPDQCKDDLITEVYNGTAMRALDTGLHSYTGELTQICMAFFLLVSKLKYA